MKRQYPGIKGNLEVLASEEEDKEFGEKWQEVVISGDPEGLRSFAELLMSLADLDQNTLQDYPDYASEHVHLDADSQLSGNSARLIVGRLDRKGGGAFHDGFKPRKHKKYLPAT